MDVAWLVGVTLAVAAAAAAALGDNLVKNAYLAQHRDIRKRKERCRVSSASGSYNNNSNQDNNRNVNSNGNSTTCVTERVEVGYHNQQPLQEQQQRNLLSQNGSVGEGEDVKPLWKRPVWVAGIFCMVVLNAGLTVASFAFVDASITIPFGGLHICFNIPLAKYINGERFSLRAILFNGLILLGVMIVLFSGNHHSQTFTAEELLEIAAAPAFIVASILMVISTVMIWTFLAKSKEVARERLGWTLFAGMVGSITQTFTKGMSECLKDGAWNMPITYVFIILTIASALSQVVFLNKCLDNYPAFFVVPLVNSTIITVGSVYAAIYFQEVNRWDLKSRICVPAGIFVTGLGILLLSFAEPEKELEQELDESDSEDVETRRGGGLSNSFGHEGLEEDSSLMRPLTEQTGNDYSSMRQGH
mmetsp:Transcript_18874/g.37088  ORF Transcript_18874/g.37088 Transcript_18874/m.37088 type:complete len:417 (-) Transcript_18874:241-1491(-)|eukprot:CAMPEP_0171571430 /NCGR_PEP_ID=MMETSP0961-20121227/3503_1 /TAXON_ID=87120 /ORGANISM="Aurantiochytrium limacinum, Strain ATCCMYA-1381" /LENGTH=416 /DNA_ID=CAMNT_0012126045 /DNA_START=17 /DNA_END=1270 /DNA_ORIENTATION=+